MDNVFQLRAQKGHTACCSL